MGTLLLVRHGQASFLADDYDQLSPLGHTQSSVLGHFWATHNLTFDHVYTGPRHRQIDTAQAVAEAYRQAAKPFPRPQILPEFDEYPGDEIYTLGTAQLLNHDAAFTTLHKAFTAAEDLSTRSATFQRLFERILTEWVRGTLSAPNLETWPAFVDRVTAALQRITASSARIAVFTSGGPIAIAIQRALHLTPEATLQTSFMSRNASWTEFLFSTNRFTLSTFNTHPHLYPNPTLLTYR